MNKKRILIISTVGLTYDGITNIICSYLEAMDLTQLEIYLAGTIKVETSIKDKLELLECKVIVLPNRRKETLKYFIDLIKLIKDKEIQVVHAHGNSTTLIIELLAAWLGGAKKRIAHSHNTRCNHVIANRMLRPFFNALYTDAVACGEVAGKWLFGGRCFKVLTNGRDIERYTFKPDIRAKMRKRYNLTNELILGHVGGFVEQKNHVFLIKIFREILKKDKNVKLFLIGDGPLKSHIDELTRDISNYIVFVGTTNHVEDYLQMMDVMILPSLFEGLPLVTIEWQINGLPCLVSDNVTKNCSVSDYVKFISPNVEALKWAEQILELRISKNRVQQSAIGAKKAALSGFDISKNADDLLQLYID